MADIAGPLLVRAGLITQAQLIVAQKARSENGGTISEHLVAHGALDEESLCNFYRQRLLVPRVGMAEMARIAPQIIRRIPADMAGEFRVIPIDYDREQNLIIAMAEPSDTHAIDEIGFFTGSFVMRAVAPASAIAWALANYYGIHVGPSPAPRRTAAPIGSAPPARQQTPVPIEVTHSGSGAVIVDHARPLELEAKVIVSPQTQPPPVAAPPAPPAPKKPLATIVDDVYGEDTPLPQPIPFDITQPRPLISAADLAASEAAAPEPIMAENEASLPHRTKTPTSPQVDPERVLAMALESLRFASDRDEIAAVLVSYLGRLCRRAALFVVRKGMLTGWLGHGQSVRAEDLKRASLPLDAPSIFRDVVSTRLPFRGPLIDAASRDFVIEALGWAPDDMLALPISLREKVVSVLYGDGYYGDVPDEHLALVARAAQAGLERALALKKQ